MSPKYLFIFISLWICKKLNVRLLSLNFCSTKSGKMRKENNFYTYISHDPTFITHNQLPFIFTNFKLSTDFTFWWRVKREKEQNSFSIEEFRKESIKKQNWERNKRWQGGDLSGREENERGGERNQRESNSGWPGSAEWTARTTSRRSMWRQQRRTVEAKLIGKAMALLDESRTATADLAALRSEIGDSELTVVISVVKATRIDRRRLEFSEGRSCVHRIDEAVWRDWERERKKWVRGRRRVAGSHRRRREGGGGNCSRAPLIWEWEGRQNWGGEETWASGEKRTSGLMFLLSKNELTHFCGWAAVQKLVIGPRVIYFWLGPVY